MNVYITMKTAKSMNTTTGNAQTPKLAEINTIELKKLANIPLIVDSMSPKNESAADAMLRTKDSAPDRTSF